MYIIVSERGRESLKKVGCVGQTEQWMQQREHVASFDCESSSRVDMRSFHAFRLTDF